MEFTIPVARRRPASSHLKSQAGAFDLPSIIVGVVVVGILTAGVLAAIFGVIPFAQDKAAKQDLAALRTAEGTAKVKSVEGAYLDEQALVSSGYMTEAPNMAVGTDASGSCYAGVARSGSGNVFVATDTSNGASPYVEGATTIDCALDPSLDALVYAVSDNPGASGPTPDTGWSGKLAAWGFAGQGQYGDGRSEYPNYPDTEWFPLEETGESEAAVGGRTVTAVDISGGHGCAVEGDELLCWGSNNYGQLGNGEITSDYRDSTAPAPVDLSGSSLSGKSISQVAVNEEASCALAEGEVYCWGSNAAGLLGNNSSMSTPYKYPAPGSPVSGLLADKDVSMIETNGYETVCAVAEGDVYCWGGGWRGEFGNGTESGSPVPVKADAMPNGEPVTDLSIGLNGSVCAIAGGEGFCWGANGDGQLGDGESYYISTTPVAVNTDAFPADYVMTDIAVGDDHACAVVSGSAYCWGVADPFYAGDKASLGRGDVGEEESALPEPVLTLEGGLSGKTVTGVASGSSTSCATTSDGEVFCWGENNEGELGNGTVEENSSIPVKVIGHLDGQNAFKVIGGNGDTYFAAYTE